MENKNIGGLWKKTTLQGLEYFSGNVEIGGKKIHIAAFPNNRKQNPKSPDYNILLSDYKPQGKRATTETRSYQEEQGNEDIPV